MDTDWHLARNAKGYTLYEMAARFGVRAPLPGKGPPTLASHPCHKACAPPSPRRVTPISSVAGRGSISAVATNVAISGGAQQRGANNPVPGPTNATA